MGGTKLQAGQWPSVQEFKGRFKRISKRRSDVSKSSTKTEKEESVRRPRILCTLSLVQEHMEEFRCMICKHVSPNKDDLSWHVKDHFSCPPFRCRNCKREFIDKSDLRKHIDTSHRRGRVCEICHQRFGKRRLLQQHMVLVHKLVLDPGNKSRFGSIVCCICREDFYTIRGLDRHVVALHAYRHGTFPCQNCPLSFGSESNRDSHFLFAHTKWSTKELLKLHV
jgi:hypothetical protein